jgi:primosomal protein N' (replication factor Y)
MGVGPRVVRVLPDVAAIDKEFDYLVPDGAEVQVGDVVRIQLQGRRVGGWIVAVDVEPEPGVALKPLAKVSGRGPSAELIDLAAWAARRWIGRRASFLRTAAPPGVVPRDGRAAVTAPRSRAGAAPASGATASAVPGAATQPGYAPATPGGGASAVAGAETAIGAASASGSATASGVAGLGGDGVGDGASGLIERVLVAERGVVRLGPGADRFPLLRWCVVDGARRMPVGDPSGLGAGQVLVLCPSMDEARNLDRRFTSARIPTALLDGDEPPRQASAAWQRAASGLAMVVIGARAAAWAPAARLARIVVLDEHDEVYQQEQAPTWHARDVAIERARRAGVPCPLVSPCPSLEALAWGERITDERPAERAAWPRVDVVDQRELDPALGPLFSPRLVDLVRSDRSVVCVLNRTGRARLLACTACSSLARCGVCDAAVHQTESTADGDAAGFACGRCGTERPMVCLVCGGSRFKNLRLGVSRVREELEVLAGRPVAELTAATAPEDLDAHATPLVVGTEAALHRVRWADAVAFLDFDQELLALRHRAAEEAMALLVRAGRLVQRAAARQGATGSDRRGLVLVQTRTPDHPVLVAAHQADPSRLVASELPLRQALGLPPAAAMAAVSGAAAPEFMGALGEPDGVRIQGPLDGLWRVIAPSHERLLAVLGAVQRPPGRLRIAVDPLRL